jgi:hypothetical protein
VIAGAKIDIFCVYARVFRKKNAKYFIFLSNMLNLRGEVDRFFFHLIGVLKFDQLIGIFAGS